MPAEAVAAVWPAVRPLVGAALAHADGRYAPEDVLAALRDRRMQLWLAGEGGLEAVCVTEILDYPRQRRCNLFLCAGRARRRWLAGLAAIEGWARAEGCAAMELQGRRGWQRLLPDYRPTHVLLRKDLTDERWRTEFLDDG